MIANPGQFRDQLHSGPVAQSPAPSVDAHSASAPGSTPPQGPSATPDAFDALADLFLGELGPAASHDAALGVKPAASATGAKNATLAHTHAGNTSPHSLHDLVAGHLHDREHHHRAGRDEPITSSSHALGPSMAQGASTDAKLATTSPAHTLVIESLVLGHLPVMSSAWAHEYAHHVACVSAGNVALVRLAGPRVHIDVFAPARHAGHSHASSTFISAGTLADAVVVLRRTCVRVIVHVDHADEMGAIESPGVSQVTLLTSADEAGVVNAYRTIKKVSQRVESARGLHADTLLKVAIMGAPEPRAQYVWRRLQESAETFLGLHLTLSASIPRIGAANPASAGQGHGGGVPGAHGHAQSRTMFEGLCDESVADLVNMLTRPLPSAAPQPSADASPATSPRPQAPGTARPVLRVADHASDEGECDIDHGAPAATSSTLIAWGTTPSQSDVVLGPPAHVSQSTLDAPAQSTAGAMLADSAEAAQLRLSSCIPGLSPLRARCPHAPDVELALDAQGRLQLLARWRSDEPDHRVFERLHAAACWARVHAQVLALTLPSSGPRDGDGAPGGAATVAFDASSPTRHLFTDRPAEQRSLIESDVKLHMLVEVKVAQQRPWVCAPVN